MTTPKITEVTFNELTQILFIDALLDEDITRYKLMKQLNDFVGLEELFDEVGWRDDELGGGYQYIERDLVQDIHGNWYRIID